MAIIDARKLPHGFAVDTDICIVGAGAAGLTLAGALQSAGREVCVLEAGEFTPDEKTQELYDLDCAGYPVRENYMARARYYGGTCNLWAGRAMKLAHTDVGERSWLGDPGSAWPMSYAELDRYYDLAAKVLRLPHDPQTACSDRMSEDEKAMLGGDAFLANIALWAKKPMRFGRSYRRLFRNKKFKLCLNANVTEIMLDDNGQRVESIVARSLTGTELTVRAQTYVLAAGGLENARLLLVSQRTHESGVGNHNDLVGRYYMDHPRAVFGRVRLHKPVALSTILGTPVADGKIQLGLGLSEETQRRFGVVNSYLSLEPQLSNVAEARYRTSISVAKVLLRRGTRAAGWTGRR